METTHCNAHCNTHCQYFTVFFEGGRQSWKQITATHINIDTIYTRTKCRRPQYDYGVAADSRIDNIIGLFCRIMSLLQGSFTKETYNFIDPTNQSHPISARSSTGWRRCIGCLNLQVSLCKRATNYRALLRKMTYEDKASYVFPPPSTVSLFRGLNEYVHRSLWVSF